MIRQTAAWAAQAPDWASPPRYLSPNTVRRTRADAQAASGEVWAESGETPAEGWKRAYRAGWRVVRVRVIAEDDLP
jgi:hypothetical protein